MDNANSLAKVRDTDTGGEVEVLLALLVPDLGALPLDEDVVVDAGKSRGDVLLAGREKAREVGVGSGHCGRYASWVICGVKKTGEAR